MAGKGMKDNRQYPRVIREDSMSLRAMESDRPGAELSEPAYCSTVDISAAGMQVFLTEPMPIRQCVDIWIVLADSLGTFHLQGRINRLVELDDPDEPEGFLAGIELLNSSPHIKGWRELF